MLFVPQPKAELTSSWSVPWVRSSKETYGCVLRYTRNHESIRRVSVDFSAEVLDIYSPASEESYSLPVKANKGHVLHIEGVKSSVLICFLEKQAKY